MTREGWHNKHACDSDLCSRGWGIQLFILSLCQRLLCHSAFFPYWTLNLPDFIAWHLNVNCVLWLFMLMCNVVKSSSISLLLVSVLAKGWGKQLGSAKWSCTWRPEPIGTHVLLKWQMWLQRTTLCCVSVCSGIRAAALHKKRLCDLLYRWSQHVRFWVSEGHSRWCTQTVLLFLSSSFIHSGN